MVKVMERPIGDYVSAQLSIISSIIHLFILIFIIHHKQLRKVQTHRLLINLSLGHFLTGITNFSGTFVVLDLSKVTYAWYVYANLSLLALTVDRSFSIFWPFKYQMTSTLTKVVFLAFSPTCCLVYLGKMVFQPTNTKKVADNHASMKFFIFGMGLEIILLIIANSFIFMAVRRQKRKIAAANVPNSNRNTASRNEIARFYVCFGCIITYALLWAPALLLKIVEIYGEVSMDHKYFSITIAIANINPLSDAFLLLFFNRELKKILKNILYGKLSQDTPRVSVLEANT